MCACVCAFFWQAKMLEEMDSEFGIGSLIEEEFGTAKKQVCTTYNFTTSMDKYRICYSLLF